MKVASLPASMSFRSRSEWRDWLLQHHQTKTNAWIVILKKNTKASGIFYDEAVEEAVCFGWIDNKMRSVDDATYILNFTPRKNDSIWSALNRRQAESMISMHKMAAAGLASIENAKKSGSWDAAYSSKAIPAIPEDLLQELRMDPANLERFEQLSNSQQLQYITWVMQAKTAQTRAKRIMAIATRMRLPKKDGNAIE